MLWVKIQEYERVKGLEILDWLSGLIIDSLQVSDPEFRTGSFVDSIVFRKIQL